MIQVKWSFEQPFHFPPLLKQKPYFNHSQIGETKLTPNLKVFTIQFEPNHLTNGCCLNNKNQK